MPYLRVMSSFRDSVRRLAIAQGDNALKEILALSDRLRDVDLVPLGVALDDQDGGSFYWSRGVYSQYVSQSDGKALVKLVDPAHLIKARDEKRALADAKAAKKAASVEADRLKRLQKIEKGRIPPNDMFKPPNVAEGLYGSWDALGMPLTDGGGEPLSKNAGKKAQKDYAVQQKAHQEFLQWQKEQHQ